MADLIRNHPSFEECREVCVDIYECMYLVGMLGYGGRGVSSVDGG